MKENVGTSEHWETVYRKKRYDETSWHQPVPHESLSMVARAGMTPDTPFIDVGGGASGLAGQLLDLGYHDVTVLDISGAALEQARRRLGKRWAQLNWIKADVTGFRPERQYGLWHDRAAFHFLTRAGDRQSYANVLDKALETGGQAIIATFSPRGPKKCSGLDIVQYDAPKIEETLGSAFRLLEQRESLHLTPGGLEQEFNYFRFLKI